MKLVLVDNLVLPDRDELALLDVHPHLGLLALAAAAENSGHAVQIYDPKRLIRSRALPYDASLYERAAASILAQQPEVVGFTSLGCSFLFALNVAAEIKRGEPELPILLGGPHATMLDRPILERFPQFDVIVRHEADEILPEVLDKLAQRTFDNLPGISWRGAGGTFRATPGKPIVHDLDRLPLLSYDHYPIAELGLELLRVEAGRGCPFMCTFCSTATFFQRDFRLKSAQRLVLEMERLRDRYGFVEFKLDHDMFTVSKRKVLEFCEAVRGRGFRWRVSARVDCVNATLLERMADAGCVGLYFGIETGSVRMQKLTRKRLDLGLVRPTLTVAHRHGIETTTSFITGYPEETDADQDDTLDMAGDLMDANNLVQLHMLQPEPGTQQFERLGMHIVYDGHSSPFNTYLLSATDRSHVLSDPQVFQTYYFYPTLLPREYNVFAVAALDVLRGIGGTVLHYVLRPFDNRLSRFIAAWRAEWDEANAATLEAFIAGRFGPAHHVTSLFRYALALHPPAPKIAMHEHADLPFDATQFYRVSAHVRVLPPLHDCERLLRQITTIADSGGLLPEEPQTVLVVYLVHAGGSRTMAYRIDDGIRMLLELFAQPRRCVDIARALGPQSEASLTLLARLAEMHILVPESLQ